MSIIDGTSSQDTLVGTDRDDTLKGFAGNDTLDGKRGDDTAVYSGRLAEFRFGEQDGYLVIEDTSHIDLNEGTDRLLDIEAIQFSDALVSITGSRFQVNSTETSIQGNPSATRLTSGGFLVSWLSVDGLWSHDGQIYDIEGRPEGSELQFGIVQGAERNQVVGLLGGGFALIWVSYAGSEIDCGFNRSTQHGY